MANNITELRKHLFETLEALKRKENPMEVDRAKAISQVAQSIIDSARVELKFADMTGQTVSEFLPQPRTPRPNGHLPEHTPELQKGLEIGKHLGK